MMTHNISGGTLSDEQGVIKRMKDAYDVGLEENRSFWEQASMDSRVKAGDASILSELYPSRDTYQRNFNFNRVRRVISMVSGAQRDRRNATTLFPMDGSDEETTDQLGNILSWSYQAINAYHTISEAYEGAITTGLNMLSAWMDYRDDPINGELKLDNLGYNALMLDTSFSKPDLSDCDFVWSRKYVTKEQAISLVPARKKDIKEMRGSFDDKFSFLPEATSRQNPNLISYDEFWYTDYRPVTLLVDTKSGDTLEWTGDKPSLQEYLKAFPEITTSKIEKQMVRLAVVVGGIVMYDGQHPYGIDRYPFVPVFGYFDPTLQTFSERVQDMVRGLRDSQFLYNRRKVIELDMLESQINSGTKVMEDALVDKNDAFKKGQGQVLFIKKSAKLGMGSVESILPPQIPPSTMQLTELLAQEIPQISGVNEELLGSAKDDKSGILSMLRQGAGMITLQSLSDSLDRSQKLLDRKSTRLNSSHIPLSRMPSSA